jgi:peptidoglycan/LPS O-acetylase OafA/YrhL
LERQHSFVTLDAMRGVAATLVISYHFGLYFGLSDVPHAYLAVDFFFMLSGFVLTYAYQKKLDNGWSTSAYFKARIIRLYPLYLAGLLLGFILQLLQHRFGTTMSGHPVSIPAAFELLVLGLFFLPAPPIFAPGLLSTFPLNVPSWSLFYELIANLFHALVLRRRSMKFRIGVIAVSGAGLAYSDYKFHTVNIGFDWPQLPFAIFRVLFAYTLGSLLPSLWGAGDGQVRYKPLYFVLLLLALFALPYHWGSTMIGDFTAVAVFFPLLLLIAASLEPARWLNGFCRMLGVSSYALYVLHVPVFHVVEQAWKIVRHRPMKSDAPWSGILTLLFLFVITQFIDRYYDQTVRAGLRRKLQIT